MRWTPILIAVLAGAIGCSTGTDPYDTDEDGTVDQLDCNPSDPTIHPQAADPYGDEIDQDCDGLDGIDRDGDGYPANPDLAGQPLHDCDDLNATVHPGAEEVVDDDYDNDCDGFEAIDLDDDGFLLGLDDCDDSDPTVHDGAQEQPDGVDDDCDGTIDEDTAGTDDDGDGYCEGHEYEAGVPSCIDEADPGDCRDADPAFHPADVDGDGVSPCGDDGLADTSDDDCDDDDATVHPGAVELCNGRDDDCTDGIPSAEFDGDGDGITGCAGDCADADAAIFPGAVEACDVADNDCDGAVDEGFDADGDGFTPCGLTPDCDDLDNTIHPGAAEACDLVDNDCDGVQTNEQDDDGDGDPACSDCDEDNPAINTLDADDDGYSTCDDPADCDDVDEDRNPGELDNVEISGIDTNCDGLDGVDFDGDGSASTTSGGLDCDDTDAAVHGLDTDGDGWTLCGIDGVLGTGDEDCDDTDPALNPSDSDGDGHSGCSGDCDDTEPTVFPSAPPLCDGLDNDCDGWADVSGDFSDFDGDGSVACADCDDDDPAIHPGGPELCDGIDSNCDGVLPANGPDGEFDNDGDGWLECEGDCNDFSELMNPGIVDFCDGIDTDCDGVPDNDPDADGDGWCEGDCDDNDPTRHPDQWEDPFDGVDLDCDGNDAAGLEWMGMQLYGVEPGSDQWGLGDTVTWIPDFTGDGLPELATSAPFAAVTSIGFAGWVYVVTSEQMAGWPDFDLGQAHTIIRSQTEASFLGFSLRGMEDMDGDGLGDLLVKDSNPTPAVVDGKGSVRLFSGATLAPGGVLFPSAASVTILGSAPGGVLAEGGIEPIGDPDGDGLADFAVGAANAESGAVYLVRASDLPVSGTWTVDQATTIISGAVVGDQFGWKIAAVELDADGVLDLAVSAPSAGNAAGGEGLVYGFLGGQLQAGGSFTVADAQFTIGGSPGDIKLGEIMEPLPDLDGDGLDELAVNCGSGFTLRVFTGAQLMAMPGQILPMIDAWMAVSAPYGGHGSTVAGADLDGDGAAELIVGAFGDDSAAEPLGADSGAIWVYDGTMLQYGGLFTTATATTVLLGTGSMDRLGSVPLAITDIEDDGLPELAIHVPYDDTLAVDAGKVVILPGGSY